MKQTDRAEKHLDLLPQRYPILTVQKEEIRKAYQVMAAAYEAGGKLNRRQRRLCCRCRTYCRRTDETL